jgi:hypothetical protein
MSQRISFLLVSALLVLPCCKSKDEAKSKAPAPESEGTTVDEPAVQPEPMKDAEPAAATRLETDDFTVPIPAGFKAYEKEKLAGLSAQVEQEVAGVLIKPRAAPDHFVTTFIFTLIASDTGEPTEGCALIAKEMAKEPGVEAETPKLVEFPFGKTCQFEMGNDKQSAIQTIVFVGKKWWTLTCNFDPRDEASSKECNEVLTDFASK